jgi:hypothetical protein
MEPHIRNIYREACCAKQEYSQEHDEDQGGLTGFTPPRLTVNAQQLIIRTNHISHF